MDTLRGSFEDLENQDDYDFEEEDHHQEGPPAAIGQDERRMQVRAYNHWASLLGDRHLPSVEDLEPDQLPDFGPYSVLLDFSAGVENPAIAYLGATLAEECEAGHAHIRTLADVPSRSLLSRITDHYMQILANKAPIGFEAEFVNQRGSTILYRGILLPFSTDDDTIDFIYGVINWREIADQNTTDELLLEIGQMAEPAAGTGVAASLTEWADGPRTGASSAPEHARSGLYDAMPRPQFGLEHIMLPDGDEQAPSPPLAMADPRDMVLGDWLAAARDMANAVRGSEDRTRNFLYEAISRAHDFALASADAPGDFAELLADAGLKRQDRAPMTPITKLVFGADYDKTRLTEYAAVLSYAQRNAVPRGALAELLRETEGGLKAIVQAERAWRRDQTGKPTARRDGPPARLARKLREMEAQPLSSVAGDGREFGLVMIRRTGEGEVLMLGEVSDDGKLVDRAAKHLTA